MITVVSALLPTFLIIAIAVAIKRAQILPEAAWLGMERTTYFVFFPVFLFRSLADANFEGYDVWPLAYALLAGIGTMAVTLAIVRIPLGATGPQYTSIYQGAIRWNGFVAVATLQGLHGTIGATLSAVAFAAIVPVVNVLCVLVLARHATGETSKRLIMKSVVTNPLVVACVLGIAARAVSLPIPGPIDATMKVLADASVSLGLFSVAAGLDFRGLVSNPRILAATAFLKLFAMPAFMALYCTLFHVTGAGRAVAVVAGAVPTAANAYILARQMGGDAPLMANIVTATTLLAFITMPVLVWLLA